MNRILLIRFGALGDLCLLAWSLSSPKDHASETRPHLTLVTKQSFTDLAAQVPAVDAVIPLPGSRFRDLWPLVQRIKGQEFDQIIDAHSNLRSHLLLTLLGRRPRRRLAKDTAARLAFLTWRRASVHLKRTMRERFDAIIPPELKATGPVVADNLQDSPTADRALQPPLLHLRPRADHLTITPILGIAPGAHWASKRWPEKNFCMLLQMFREVNAGPVHIFLGPREASWFPGSNLATLAAELDRVQVWQNLDLISIARALAACSTLVTNDSGLSHLAEAVGTPVVVLFGPTVREFGYFPTLPTSRVLETELSCRPCSRNGKRSCYRGDLACLARISPQNVLTTLLDMSPWRTAAAGDHERI